MLRIAGQTNGPIGLKFFVDTHGWWGGGCYRLKSNRNLKKNSPRATPGPLASNKYKYLGKGS